MKRLAPLIALALAACAAGAGDDGLGPRLRPAANPSAVIAAELGFAQLAQEKGQWTAFRETAAPDAVMFAPQMVLAQQWLKGRADPPVAVKWQPHQVWSSCDGSVVITHGAWQRPHAVGYFTTVWQRQKDGGYRWVFDHGDSMGLPIEAPEMIAAKVAECTKTRLAAPAAQQAVAPFNPVSRHGQSDDGTLTWGVSAQPDGAHNFSAEMRQDGAMVQIVIEQVSGPEG